MSSLAQTLALPPVLWAATLVPILQSDDKILRRAAADALGTYSGEEVVREKICSE